MLCWAQNDPPARREDVFTDVVMWNNDLAAGMMTLEQEAEAFGETPPAPRYNLPGGGLDELEEGKENENPALRDDDDFWLDDSLDLTMISYWAVVT